MSFNTSYMFVYLEDDKKWCLFEVFLIIIIIERRSFYFHYIKRLPWKLTESSASFFVDASSWNAKQWHNSSFSSFHTLTVHNNDLGYVRGCILSADERKLHMPVYRKATKRFLYNYSKLNLSTVIITQHEHIQKI